MPKNAGMGGKKRKGGKKNNAFDERELQFAGEMQNYGQVLRLLGDSRLEIQCTDGMKRIGHIRGTMKKKVWIAMGDVVLVSRREFEDDKCDIILKYTEEEVRKLKSLSEIPESIKLPENENKPNDDADIVFGSDDEDKPNENDNKKRKNKKEVISDSDDMSDKDLDIDDI
jgi:translation initiation factor 1A